MISCACPKAYVGMSTLPPRSMVVSLMVSTIVLMESENGWVFWSASVASMMSRSMSFTSGSRAEGMEKWSSMQMSPVWKTVAGPDWSSTLAAPRMWPLSVSVTVASPTSSGSPTGTGPTRARRARYVPALGGRHLGAPALQRLAERYGHEPLPDLVDGGPAGQASPHGRVVVERAHYELRRRGGAVDRQPGPISDEQRQGPAVVEVGVRYDGRVYPVDGPEVGRRGAPAGGP